MLSWWKIPRPKATRELTNYAFNQTFIKLSEGPHEEFGFLKRHPNSPFKLVEPKKPQKITWKL